MGKRNHPENNESTPTSQQVITDNTEKVSERSISYVVVRGESRVSNREYSTPNDTYALEEQYFWKTLTERHSHNEPVKIVQYDSKKHRVW